jgi:hypothetical protein
LRPILDCTLPPEKKQQFDLSQQEIEEEKKKLDAIIAEKEA